MKFKNLSIIGGGPNCVYAIEILLKNILVTPQVEFKVLVYML